MTAPSTTPSPILIPAFPPVWAEVYGEDEYGVFAEFSLKGVKFVWRWIPPGRFIMGSDKSSDPHAYDDETPAHPVVITQGFWMGETPVTQAQWEEVMGDQPSRFPGPDRPVESIHWRECQEFTRRLAELVPDLLPGLPTEAQWEYACRARTCGAYQDGTPCTQPTGSDPALEKLGWFEENSGGQTHPVKGKLPNRWGLYDLHGNVWEWCLDGARRYTDALSVDPVGPLGVRRVERGGSWSTAPRGCRVAYRAGDDPDARGSMLGFRLAAGLKSGMGSPSGLERPDGTEVAREETPGTPRVAR